MIHLFDRSFDMAFLQPVFIHTHLHSDHLLPCWNLVTMALVTSQPLYSHLSPKLGNIIQCFPVTQKGLWAKRSVYILDVTWNKEEEMQLVERSHSMPVSSQKREHCKPTGWEQSPNCRWNSINVVLKKLIICYNNQLLLPLCIWRFVNYFHLRCNWFHFYHLFKFMWLFSS